jgi:hypothetical protein
MIVFNLKCSEGHAFEEWFASSAEYEAKTAADELACPECGDTHVAKGLSAPRINGGAQAPSVGPCAGGVCQMAN